MTTPDRETGEGTRIEEFASVLAPVDGSDKPVLVGGHAANLWSQHFLVLGRKELAAFMPFTSKDLDLIGTGELLQRLWVSLKGEMKMSEPRSPVVGRVRCQGPYGKPWVISIWPLEMLRDPATPKVARWAAHRLAQR
jgi:hypothetical protein